MENNKEQSSWKSLLADEAAIGLSFSNLFIAVGIGLIGLLAAGSASSAPLLLAVQGTTLVIAGFYASICYANTHGVLRSYDIGKVAALKPIIWGNAISEYLGVYVLNFTIPAVIWSFTSDPNMTRVSYSILFLAFLIYHLTEFDLLGRIIKRTIFRMAVAIFIVGLGVVYLEMLISGEMIFAYISYSIYSLVSLILLAMHVLVTEK